MGEMEYGKCEVCGKENSLTRTYYHYNIKCECHSPTHFVVVKHCRGCIPKPPREIKVYLKGKDYLIDEERSYTDEQ